MNAIDRTGKKYNRLWFVITLLAGTFTMSISQSSLSTAYPTLMRYFDISASTVQWLTTGFMLIMCVTMPMSPWLLNNVSFKRLFLTILLVFDAGTLVIVLAPSFWVMMVGRIMEAIAVGVLFPSFQSVLLTITDERPTWQDNGDGWIGNGVRISLWTNHFRHCAELLFLAGPICCFYASDLTCFCGGTGGPDSDVMPQKSSHLDYWSVVLSVGLIGVLYVINQIGQKNIDWGKNSILLVVSVGALVWFVIRQFHLTTPLLELRVMKTINFDLAVILTAISYVALIVTTIIFPLYYQEVLGVSPLISGLALVPAAVFLSILNPLTGKLADKVGFRHVMLTGMGLIVLGWLLVTVLTEQLNIWIMMGCAMIIEGGNAFVMMPAVTMGANALPTQLVPHGTAVTTTIRQILGSTGVAVATLVLTTVTQHQNVSGVAANVAQISGFRVTFILMLAIELVGLVLALALRDTQAK
jgi:MFS family permease